MDCLTFGVLGGINEAPTISGLYADPFMSF